MNERKKIKSEEKEGMMGEKDEKHQKEGNGEVEEEHDGVGRGPRGGGGGDDGGGGGYIDLEERGKGC